MKEFERRTLVEALELARKGSRSPHCFTLLERIQVKLLAMLQEDLPKWADPECPTCLAQGEHMGPSHNGSQRCESGSIASGGERSHCTCDTCF